VNGLLVCHSALGVLDLRAQHRELLARERCKRGIVGRLEIAFEQVDYRLILGNLCCIEASDKTRSVRSFGLDQARARRRRLGDARFGADRFLNWLQGLVAPGRFFGTQGGEVLDLGIALEVGALQQTLLEAAEV